MSTLLPATTPGIGIDIAEVLRVQNAIERGGQTFLDKVFTSAEQTECNRRPNPWPHFAARFAAKEAGMKALGTGWTGGVGFLDFEVISDGASAPQLKLHGQAAQRSKDANLPAMRLSMSHTDDLATAIVVVL
ncbi:MAG: holo-ACP synthase [Planctomycetes bacterium]|nr:holo-ACP synthase [Planctomycetota bacterium]MBT4029013.1 holo-ACP synthase [Planctomycetota bacterium]MBT4560281.1 holo-ACP synthase [Planctomycetota bacterium]MBT5119989.1 holo-ACP synthase [Planctomycetota bacterium]MBT7012628.1 holo-ACP synthase [Planctomycetota bacterium]